MNLLALIALSREVADYYSREMTKHSVRGAQWDPDGLDADWHHLKIARDFTYSALWMAYGAMLMVVGFWRRSAFVRWQALVLIAFTIGKVFLYDVSELDRGYRIVSFIVLGVLLLAISFMYQRDWLKLSSRESIQRKLRRHMKSGLPRPRDRDRGSRCGLGTGPSISYFTNVRDVRISQADQQNYFVVDEEIWTRARPDLADLRIYDGESQVQYALSEQRGGMSSHEPAQESSIWGASGGRTEFDLDTGRNQSNTTASDCSWMLKTSW